MEGLLEGVFKTRENPCWGTVSRPCPPVGAPSPDPAPLLGHGLATLPPCWGTVSRPCPCWRNLFPGDTFGQPSGGSGEPRRRRLEHLADTLSVARFIGHRAENSGGRRLLDLMNAVTTSFSDTLQGRDSTISGKRFCRGNTT